jgi:predicted metalloprotease with PDZ domain
MGQLRLLPLALAVGCVAFLGGHIAIAQTTLGPAQLPSGIAAPTDTPYPGTIRLAVDATDVARHIFRIKEMIPVQSGALTLLYPKWVPGNHSPTGRIDLLAGLSIKGNGVALEWVRDTVDVYAFHLDVPVGVTSIDLEFQFLSATEGNQGRIVMTPEMLNLQWSSVALYPAGHFARQITFEPTVRLLDGWQFATALEVASAMGATTTFKSVSFDTLVDSPLFAGRYAKRFDLNAPGSAPVRLNVFADRAELLEAKAEHVEAHRALVTQAYRLFGAHHYDHYDFLLALTDRMGGIGLEHHRSSENGTAPTYFTEWDKNPGTRDLLPHEFTHSWNGKFRRPADLLTENYNVPMRNSLLWVYEGQTQYWGYVLAARAGLLSKQQALDALALTSAYYERRPGREWKSLQDTTNDPIIGGRRPLPWRSWQRSEDYYSEGELLWLDVDTLIRELSSGQKSLDDFARAFFGGDDGTWAPVSYTLDDVVKALNAVQQFDWRQFVQARLDSHKYVPLDGISRGGYKLVYSDTPSDYLKRVESGRKAIDLTFSLGVVIGRESRLVDVLWGGPAHAAGMSVGMQIVAVDGTAYDGDRLKERIKATKTNNAPIDLLVKDGDRYNTIRIDYHEGLRYPHLEREPNVPARLDEILSPRKGPDR